MRELPTRRRAILAAAAFALFSSVQAGAAELVPEEAAQLINAVRQQVAACGETARTGGLRDDASAMPNRTPLVWNAQLATAAEQHSRAMADQAFFDHVGRDGRRVSQRADAVGYRWRFIGENLAAGHRTLEAALRGWLRSEGHCRNLLDERYSDFGLARVVSDRPNDRFRVYWTLVFGRPAIPVVRTASAN